MSYDEQADECITQVFDYRDTIGRAVSHLDKKIKAAITAVRDNSITKNRLALVKLRVERQTMYEVYSDLGYILGIDDEEEDEHEKAGELDCAPAEAVEVITPTDSVPIRRKAHADLVAWLAKLTKGHGYQLVFKAYMYADISKAIDFKNLRYDEEEDAWFLLTERAYTKYYVHGLSTEAIYELINLQNIK